MDRLNLILPKNGVTNWGNAINENFIQLLNEANRLNSEVQYVKAQVEADVTINLSTDTFLYLSSSDDPVVAYENNMSNWENPSKDGNQFDPKNAGHLDAYIMKVKGNSALSYNEQSYFTNDILYIIQSANGNTVRRWASSVGGYYLPKQLNIAPNGTVELEFYKTPAMLLTGQDTVKFHNNLIITPYIRTEQLYTAQPVTVLVSNQFDYNNCYVYGLQLFNKSTLVRFEIGYTVTVNDQGKIQLNFDSPLPSDTQCNLIILSDNQPQSNLDLTVNATANVPIILSVSLGTIINWGDGTIDQDFNSTTVTHTYNTTGTYIIHITGSQTIGSDFISPTDVLQAIHIYEV